MKAKKLLSLLTAVAVVATIGISYAAWDTTKVSDNGTIAIAEQMKVEMTGLTFAADKLAPAGSFAVTNDGAKASVAGTVTVKVPAAFIGKTDIQLAVDSVKDGDTAIDDFANIFSFTFKKAAATLANGTDTDVKDASTEYTVEVTLKDESTLTEAYLTAITGKTLTFAVSAEAVAHSAA